VTLLQDVPTWVWLLLGLWIVASFGVAVAVGRWLRLL
jgi:hypothetical protein